MSISKNKPYPFKKVALATTFSPRLSANIHEASRFCKTYQSEQLYLIHIGEDTPANREKIETAAQPLRNLSVAYTVIIRTGNPSEEILAICKQEAVDILVFGALKKESIFHYYLGSVARNLSRKAKCSILLLVEPKEEASPLRHIVVSGNDNPKTEFTVETAYYMAEREHATKVSIVSEVDLPFIANSSDDSYSKSQQAENKNEFERAAIAQNTRFVQKAEEFGDFEVTAKVIHGKAGFAIRNYALEHQPDVLLINSPDQELGFLHRVFTHDTEHLLSNIPCNLMIVHSRTGK